MNEKCQENKFLSITERLQMIELAADNRALYKALYYYAWKAVECNSHTETIFRSLCKLDHSVDISVRYSQSAW